MSFAIGSTVGSYRVIGPLGKGGMGEVWRARDTRLDRDVAIKTLPPEFAADPDRLARFEREAKVLASLNHPHIAAIYGLEAAADARFLVLELVEGETLADRLTRGPLPVAEALGLAAQIADAIEAAHEKDIIHRDLKPSNIQITADGKVKVLDFGLAKALDADPAHSQIFNSPTFSMAATAQGVILGTAAYMSPEQARAQPVDRRTDVWGFGCILYEMLTGKQAFRGETVSDLMASVLAREPEYTELPTTIQPRVREALRRCLDKNPKRRWQAIGDLRVELEQALANPAAGVEPSNPAATRSIGGLLLLTAAVTALIASPATWLLKPTPPPDPRPIVRFDFELPPNMQLRGTAWPLLALSPDGRQVAYNATAGVFLRSMDTLASRVIPGTEIAMNSIFFSPDGQWLAYWSASQNALQKIAVAGGSPVTIGPASSPFGATWGRDGNILFVQQDGIWRVSGEGGTPQRLIEAARGEVFFGPSLLPDGKTILYSVTRATGNNRWDIAEIVARQPGGMPTVLVRGGSDAKYLPTGHLLYAVGNVLFALAFNPETLQTSGGPVPIVTGVQRATTGGTGTANYGVSDRGTLVYLNNTTVAAGSENALALIDRNGTMIKPLDVPKANYRNPRLSPNGRSVAVETTNEANQSVIWVYDLSGSAAIRRLTQDGNNTRPVWSPDGKRIAYGSTTQKPAGIFWQLADGSGLPERLTTADDGYEHYPESFSRDGKVLSFATVKPPLGQSSWGLWTLRLDTPTRKPEVFFDLPNSNEFGSSISPDGKWIAYASNASPQSGAAPTAFAIYVQPYPATGVKYQISQTGGAWPIWSQNGHELLYRMNVTDGGAPKINVVTITTNPVPAFTAERPLPIQGFQPIVNNREYDVRPDGQQLVMVLPSSRAQNVVSPAPRITATLNWTEELKARVPVAR